MVNIFIGSDHRGYDLKERIKRCLKNKGCSVEDFGTHSEKSVNFPDFAFPVAEKVVQNNGSFGILICGTGQGMCVAANKVRSIIAANCQSIADARQARKHLNANVLCLGADFIVNHKVMDIVNTFLTTEFKGKDPDNLKYQRRLNKIARYEKSRG